MYDVSLDAWTADESLLLVEGPIRAESAGCVPVPARVDAMAPAEYRRNRSKGATGDAVQPGGS